MTKFKINDEKVKELISSFNFPELEAKHKELSEKVGNCYLSTLSIFEAMKEGDCLCLALDVVRSEAAIADPTKLVIKQIIPNFLTASAFIDAATFAVGNNPEATGGFDKNADRTMIVGANRENITGCIPLYFFKEHGRIAKLQQEKVFGFLCTLDPLGYTAAQSYTVPFLVLHRALVDLKNDPESQNKKFIYEMVLDTCKQIYFNTEIERKLDVEIRTIRDFVKDVTKRTVDVTPSIPLMFAKLLTFFNHHQRPEKFSKPKFQEVLVRVFQVAIEEIDRRNYGKEENPSTFYQVLQKIYPEFEKLVPEIVVELEQENGDEIETHIKEVISMFKDMTIEETKGDMTKPVKTVKREKQDSKAAPKSKSAISYETVAKTLEERKVEYLTGTKVDHFISERVKTIFKYSFYLKFYAEELLGKDHHLTESLMKGKLPFSKKQLLCLLIQNKMTPRNSH